MIALDEQVRRYAADVAGPARGPAPREDDGRDPQPVGRLILVAVLVVFVAGFAWLVARNLGSTEHGEVVPVEVPRLTATSWGAEPGSCTDDLPGIPLAGPDGDGLCIGYEPWPSGDLAVWQVGEGHKIGAWTLGACDEIDGSATRAAGGGGSGTAPEPIWFVLPPGVDRMVATLRSGRTVVAQTVLVPGLGGARFAAFWVGAGDALHQMPTVHTATGELYDASREEPELPDGCPGSGRAQAPTPSDSGEWEDDVLDHRGEVRGRTAGIVELADDIYAYRVVDDADVLVGYTMLDEAIGFVERDLAEDPETVRELVDCATVYVETLTATPGCTAALAAIGVDTSPAPLSEP